MEGKCMMKDRIKQLRKELHMSQTEFASSIGLHRSSERAGKEDNEIFKKNLHAAIDRLTDYQLAVLAEIAKEFGK